jgi:Zn-dependent protease
VDTPGTPPEDRSALPDRGQGVGFGGSPGAGPASIHDYSSYPPIPKYDYTQPPDQQQAATPPAQAGEWQPGRYQQSHPAGQVDVPLEKMGRRGWGGLGALGAVGATLLKFGGALKFILPGLAKAPFLISIVINIGVYTFFFGSQYGLAYGVSFATGFVALIFVHEMGHLIAARVVGIRATVPFFVPFMGAAIFLRDHPQDAKTEAIVGIGGPITGTLGALLMMGIGISFGPDSPEGLLATRLAYYGFFINLFNMIPFSPLDGGRILGAVSKWFNVVGLGVIGLGMFTGVLRSPVLILILLVGAYGTYRRFTQPEHPGYYDVSIGAKTVIGLGYLTLLAVLITGLIATEGYIT